MQRLSSLLSCCYYFGWELPRNDEDQGCGIKTGFQIFYYLAVKWWADQLPSLCFYFFPQTTTAPTTLCWEEEELTEWSTFASSKNLLFLLEPSISSKASFFKEKNEVDMFFSCLWYAVIYRHYQEAKELEKCLLM